MVLNAQIYFDKSNAIEAILQFLKCPYYLLMYVFQLNIREGYYRYLIFIKLF